MWVGGLGLLGIALLLFAVFQGLRGVIEELVGIREELARLRKMVP